MQYHSEQRLCLRLLALLLLAWATPAGAHELTIDQLMLWPDRQAQVLHGELTIDPELTRSKSDVASEAAAQRVVALLVSQLRIVVDGRTLPITYEVQELWVRGGATLGDVVVFSSSLPGSAAELRVQADAFPALVVSVQVPGERQRAETASWLLGRGEWTPVYRLAARAQRDGWTEGGPEAFTTASSALLPPGGAATSTVASAESRPLHGSLQLAVRFLRLGGQHILPDGIDHILFVVGLVLGQLRRWRRVIVILTYFTLAHTTSLALSQLFRIDAPAFLVEPLIALSICLVGLDNLRAKLPVTLSAAGRPLLAFGFGLIHGLGFANALSELPFDRGQLPVALFSFNVGVELGQVAVVAVLAICLGFIRDPRQLRKYATVPGSLVVAACGAFLMIERAGLLAQVLRASQ